MFRTCRQVAGHKVDVVGQVLPHTADLDGDRCSLTQLALGPNLAGDPSNLRDEPIELIDHCVDDVLQVQHLSADVGRHLLAQVAVGDRTDDTLHLAGGAHQGLDQTIHGFDAARPALGPPSEHDSL